VGGGEWMLGVRASMGGPPPSASWA
jgi:hypothetical protein